MAWPLAPRRQAAQMSEGRDHSHRDSDVFKLVMVVTGRAAAAAEAKMVVTVEQCQGPGPRHARAAGCQPECCANLGFKLLRPSASLSVTHQ